ncbi:hypothetical protein HK405_010514, partial [Cladochytrium tenue]
MSALRALAGVAPSVALTASPAAVAAGAAVGAAARAALARLTAPATRRHSTAAGAAASNTYVATATARPASTPSPRMFSAVSNVDNIVNAKPSRSYSVVVVGGGSAGIAVASQLAKHPFFASAKKNQILVVEPSDAHYYQPLWTFVGAGLKPHSESVRPTESLIPSRADWLRDRVTGFFPDRNMVLTQNGEHVAYDFLVVAPGIQINWSAIEGLEAALGKDGVCSNYHVEHVKSTDRFLKEFNGGNAVFTQPSTPIKCAGAPQKIMYLAEEQFRQRGIRDQSNVSFYSGMGKIFSADKYAAVLRRICDERGISVNLQRNLVAVRGDKKEAVFKVGASAETETVKYDLLHVSPPMGAPAFLRNSPEGFTNADGWVN